MCAFICLFIHILYTYACSYDKAQAANIFIHLLFEVFSTPKNGCFLYAKTVCVYYFYNAFRCGLVHSKLR